MVKDVVATIAVEFSCCQWNPVDGKAYAIFDSDVCIEAAIVLNGGKLGRGYRDVIREVSHSAKRAPWSSAACARTAAPGVLITRPAEILCAQTCTQRRTDIDPLAGNGCAIHTFGQAGSGAAPGRVEGSDHSITGEGKIL